MSFPRHFQVFATNRQHWTQLKNLVDDFPQIEYSAIDADDAFKVKLRNLEFQGSCRLVIEDY